MAAPLSSQPSPNTFSAISLHFLIDEGSSLSKIFIISFATTVALFCKLFPLQVSACIRESVNDQRGISWECICKLLESLKIQKQTPGIHVRHDKISRVKTEPPVHVWR